MQNTLISIQQLVKIIESSMSEINKFVEKALKQQREKQTMTAIGIQHTVQRIIPVLEKLSQKKYQVNLRQESDKIPPSVKVQYKEPSNEESKSKKSAKKQKIRAKQNICDSNMISSSFVEKDFNQSTTLKQKPSTPYSLFQSKRQKQLIESGSTIPNKQINKKIQPEWKSKDNHETRKKMEEQYREEVKHFKKAKKSNNLDFSFDLRPNKLKPTSIVQSSSESVTNLSLSFSQLYRNN